MKIESFFPQSTVLLQSIYLLSEGMTLTGKVKPYLDIIGWEEEGTEGCTLVVAFMGEAVVGPDQ